VPPTPSCKAPLPFFSLLIHLAPRRPTPGPPQQYEVTLREKAMAHVPVDIDLKVSEGVEGPANDSSISFKEGPADGANSGQSEKRMDRADDLTPLDRGYTKRIWRLRLMNPPKDFLQVDLDLNVPRPRWARPEARSKQPWPQTLQNVPQWRCTEGAALQLQALQQRLRGAVAATSAGGSYCNTEKDAVR
jgi:hypothetical protein